MMVTVLEFIRIYWVQIAFVIGCIITVILTCRLTIEASKCSLRNDILAIYDRCKETKKITHYQLESLKYSAQLYKKLKGNSFVDDIVERMLVCNEYVDQLIKREVGNVTVCICIVFVKKNFGKSCFSDCCVKSFHIQCVQDLAKVFSGQIFGQNFIEVIAALAISENKSAHQKQVAADNSLRAWEYFKSYNPLFDFMVNYAGDNFKINPGKDFSGDEFTGTFIVKEFRDYSVKRRQKPNESDAAELEALRRSGWSYGGQEPTAVSAYKFGGRGRSSAGGKGT